ncbi:MAG: M13 family metallopeptidase [Thermomicrobiales bacterium]|nr:M13 family metallopeptidase [Thermomicrobiales bacterium]
MMNTVRASVLRLLLLISLLATPAARAAPTFAGDSALQASLPVEMDLTVKPGDDFYRFANGGWLDQAVIPADLPAWDTMTMLDGQTRLQLVELLAAKASDPEFHTGGDAWKAVRLFQQGVDLKTRNRQAMSPIQGTLDSIAALSSSHDLHQFLETSIFQNVPGFFLMNPGPDVRGSGETIAYLSGPFLGMGNRGYYLAPDAAQQPVQRAYIDAAARLLSHSGQVTHDPEQAARRVFAFEAELAALTWSPEESLDFDRMLVEASLPELKVAYPAMNWEHYFAALGLNTDRVTVTEERYLTNLGARIEATPLEVIKNYLALQLLWSSSSSLDEETEAIAFAYFGRALNGVEVQAPIEGRILDQVNLLFGDALGQMYVAEYFSPEAREQGERLARGVVAAFRVRLHQNAWMTPETRSAAIAKLDAMRVKVGYPDTWDAYTDVVIGDSFFATALSAFSTNYRTRLARVGQPVDREDWPFPPQTVNAMYNPANNEIVVPAAVLQAPLFDPEGDVAMNLGAIGFVIGHEITHGFDIQGSQFNDKGVLGNWWAAEDAANFMELNSQVVAQYRELEVDGRSLDGDRTLAENVADLGGVQVAYDALRSNLVAGSTTSNPPGSAFTPDQRFFISAAAVWRSVIREEALTAQLAVDTHAPSVIRAVQPLRNCDAFHEAFDIAPGDPMYLSPEDRITIW